MTILAALPVKLYSQGECEPCAVPHTASASISNPVRPFCSTANFSATISNINTTCSVTYQVDIRFITPDESLSIQELFDDLVYDGAIPVFDETFFSTGGASVHLMTFRVTVPAATTPTFSFPFLPVAVGQTPLTPWDIDISITPVNTGGTLCFTPFSSNEGTLVLSTTLTWEDSYTTVEGSATVSELLDDEVLTQGHGSIILIPSSGNSNPPVLTVDVEWTAGLPAPSSKKKIYLTPGATIRVVNGGTLNLKNLDNFTCTQLAQGIIVEPGGRLNMEDCLVSDSRYGIDVQAGATIAVRNCDFVNNYIGARFNMTATPYRVTINDFSLNDFFTDGGVKAPFPGMSEQVESRGYCGIYLNDYRDFNVWGNNTFTRLANGIVGTNAIGNLGNMTFSDMNSVDVPGNYNFEGFGIRLVSKGTHWFNINEFWTAMSFTNCKTGIYASNYALNVENTTMTNVGVGIDVSKSKTRDVVIDGNSITARTHGIRSGLNEPLHSISMIRNNEITITAGLTALNDFTAGIQMDEMGLGFTPLPGQTVPLPMGTDGWEVSGNDVTMKLGGNGILYNNGFSGTLQDNEVINEAQANDYKGIYTEGATFSDVTANTVSQIMSTGVAASAAIYSSGGFANTFQCNCVDNTGVGMQFLDMADFSEAVRGNNFNTHCTGLQLGTQGVGGAYIGDQNHTGNLWDLSAITGNCLGGRNWGSPTEISQSEFRVNGTANPALNPAVFPPSNWFFNEPGSTFSGCATCSFPPQIPPRVTESSVPTGLDHAIVTGALVPDVFVSEMAWKAKYRLYRKMLRQPAIENYSSTYSAFKTSNANLSVGKLAYISEEKTKIFAASTTEDSILESRRLAWRQSMEALRQLDSLRQAGTTVSQSQYDSRVQQSATAQAQYDQYMAGLKPARQQKIQDLLTLNAAVTTSLTPDANHKTVNGIVLNLLYSDTLASGNLATLEAIAGQCPLEGGDAVYEARSIVSHFTGRSYDDLAICESGEREQRQDAAQELSDGPIVLYPNPTTGQVYWSGLNNQAVVLRVFNVLGQLQSEQTVNDNQADLGQLPEGLYALQLFAADNTLLASQKVQIVKH